MRESERERERDREIEDKREREREFLKKKCIGSILYTVCPNEFSRCGVLFTEQINKECQVLP